MDINATVKEARAHPVSADFAASCVSSGDSSGDPTRRLSTSFATASTVWETFVSAFVMFAFTDKSDFLKLNKKGALPNQNHGKENKSQ